MWALRKLPQYTNHGKFTVHCDHQAVVQAFKDVGPLKGKRSDQLNSWRIFLARYRGRMELVYKPGKDHLNTDGLSRMNTTVPTFITRIADSAEITWRADHF